jgi:superfamily II DNA or RNA helicase
MQLRRYQTETIEEVRKHFAAGKRACCVVLPTGAGKTVTAVSIVQSGFAKGSKVCWTVHRAELIRQARDTLLKNHVPCGVVAPWAPRTYEAVQVASIQTLIARDQRPDADIFVIDECHHIVADTYLKVRQSYPKAYTIGLTATPGRSDGRGLKDAFDCLVARVQPRELIALNQQDPTQGLVPCIVVGPSAPVDDLSDYPVDAYRKDCAGRRAIVFVSSVKYASELASAFNLAGIPARSIDGTMADTDRERILADFRSGKLMVLTSVQILTEGFDCPEVSAVILASKCSSEIGYIQKTGRGLRPAPWVGKRDCIVVDLFGSSKALQILPSSDRTYSLDGQALRRSDTGEMIDLPQCPRCGMFFECGMWSGGACPKCGWIRPPKRDPRVVKKEREQYVEGKLQTDSGRSAVKWLQEQLLKRGGHTGGVLIGFSKVFHRFPFGPERRESGFNECIARERAERESRAKRRTGT